MVNIITRSQLFYLSVLWICSPSVLAFQCTDKPIFHYVIDRGIVSGKAETRTIDKFIDKISNDVPVGVSIEDLNSFLGDHLAERLSRLDAERKDVISMLCGIELDVANSEAVKFLIEVANGRGASNPTKSEAESFKKLYREINSIIDEYATDINGWFVEILKIYGASNNLSIRIHNYSDSSEVEFLGIIK